jgi:hypothetical protein
VITDYVTWQYRTGPVWLVTFFINCQRALLRYFSVPLMARTLFAHWHRDAVAYRMAGLGSLALAFAWNQISRAIGFCIRAAVLTVWLLVAAVCAAGGVLSVIIFLLWPFISIGAIIGGVITALYS